MTIWAIPGFLGLPSDWNHLEIGELKGIDPYSFSWNSMEDWAKKFNAEIRKKQQSNNILLGYSMGGRLAMHALMDDPTLWESAVIVSAHPGICDPKEKAKRLKEDQEWAQRFATEEWDQLMFVWSQRPVFLHETFHFNRREKDFQRENLVHSFLAGSQGVQSDLSEEIAKLPMPILWMVGEHDTRYLVAAQKMKFSHPNSSVIIIPGAHHRLPWSHANLFKSHLRYFMVTFMTKSSSPMSGNQVDGY